MNRLTFVDDVRTDFRPRILILSASAGGGHVRAAEAVQLALACVCPDATVANVDVLDFTPGPVRTFYARTYYDVVRRTPHLVGYLYDRMDRPEPAGRVARAKAAVGDRVLRFNFHRLIPLLAGGRWDLAINTHFLPAELIASLRRAGRVSVPQVTITTDFYAHRIWVHRPCERYFAACDEAKASLATHVPADTIAATGIPIHPAFAVPKDPTACRRRHGLSDDGRPVVLQLAGGLGFGPVEQIHRGILDAARPLHVVAVCGNNAGLRGQLERIPCPPRHRRTVLGYTRDMDELMAAADVLVSKPGGLTTAEALARGAAMVVVDPIPGQESRNCDFLLENGTAVKVNHLPALTYKLEALLTEPGRLAELRRRAARLGRPRAAFDVAAQAIDLIRPRSWGAAHARYDALRDDGEAAAAAGAAVL